MNWKTGKNPQSLCDSRLFATCLGFNPDEDKRDSGNASALANDIVEFTLEIWDTGAHLDLKGFHGENFYSHINAFTNVEGEMLNEEVVSDEGILAELNFDSDAILDEIGLIVAKNWLLASRLYLAPLLVGRKSQRLADQLFAFYATANSTFLPCFSV